MAWELAEGGNAAGRNLPKFANQIHPRPRALFPANYRSAEPSSVPFSRHTRGTSRRNYPSRRVIIRIIRLFRETGEEEIFGLLSRTSERIASKLRRRSDGRFGQDNQRRSREIRHISRRGYRCEADKRAGEIHITIRQRREF